MHIYDPQAWLRLLDHYWAGFGLFLPYLFVLLTLWAGGRRGCPTSAADPRRRQRYAIFVVAVLPVALQVLVLFNDNAVHDTAAMPMAVPISILTGLAFAGVVNGASGTGPPRSAQAKATALVLALAVVTVLSVRDYWRQNANGHNLYQTIGRKIAEISTPEEVAFYYGDRELPHFPFYQYSQPFPQIIFYAQRNVAVYTDQVSARNLLALNGLQRGIVFRFYQEGGQVKMEVSRFSRR
jgi:hypothetical protein